MEIRKATKEDAEKIKEISLELIVARDTSRSQGLVEYKIPPVSEIEERINGKFLYVATESGEVIGFLMAYTDKELREFDFSEDEIVKHVLGRNKPFILWEQLAIQEKYQNGGFGLRLAKKFLEDVESSEYSTIYGPIAHKPHKNKTSIKLVESLGFDLIEEIEVYNGLTFGIYRKES
jgi:L-amino acid N-acyltransferase YncA